jgi:hypothetical protein
MHLYAVPGMFFFVGRFGKHPFRLFQDTVDIGQEFQLVGFPLIHHAKKRKTSLCL